MKINRSKNSWCRRHESLVTAILALAFLLLPFIVFTAVWGWWVFLASPVLLLFSPFITLYLSARNTRKNIEADAIDAKKRHEEFIQRSEKAGFIFTHISKMVHCGEENVFDVLKPNVVHGTYCLHCFAELSPHWALKPNLVEVCMDMLPQQDIVHAEKRLERDLEEAEKYISIYTNKRDLLLEQKQKISAVQGNAPYRDFLHPTQQCRVYEQEFPEEVEEEIEVVRKKKKVH